MLRNLLAPEKLADQDLDTLTQAGDCRAQAIGESITEYVAELRRLATHCDFKMMLYGTNSYVISVPVKMRHRERLLLVRLWSSQRQPMRLKRNPRNCTRSQKVSTTAVLALTRAPRREERKPSCYRCGEKGHSPQACKVCRGQQKRQQEQKYLDQEDLPVYHLGGRRPQPY